MSETDSNDVIEKVRRALGRSAPLTAPPTPPVIDEPIVRLVHTDLGLPELFARVAKENKIGIEMVYVEELAEKLVKFLNDHHVKTIALPGSAFLQKLGVIELLRGAGFDIKVWDVLTLDELYDIDAAVTDVWLAVAEVGALVMRSSPLHGRALSLVPPIHVAILEPKNFIPDLLDLFQKLPSDQNDKFVLITGPSKTADIEMTLVTGVHGPGIVQCFILQ
jgi:L-lactate dehydrogenase complex protein LldG